MPATSLPRPSRSRSCAILLLLALGGATSFARGESPSSASEVRERRLFRADDPLWRRLLALPSALPLLVSWPVKHALLWAERVDLPERISDAVLYPFRRIGGEQEEP